MKRGFSPVAADDEVLSPVAADDEVLSTFTHRADIRAARVPVAADAISVTRLLQRHVSLTADPRQTNGQNAA